MPWIVLQSVVLPSVLEVLLVRLVLVPSAGDDFVLHSHQRQMICVLVLLGCQVSVY